MYLLSSRHHPIGRPKPANRGIYPSGPTQFHLAAIRHCYQSYLAFLHGEYLKDIIAACRQVIKCTQLTLLKHSVFIVYDLRHLSKRKTWTKKNYNIEIALWICLSARITIEWEVIYWEILLTQVFIWNQLPEDRAKNCMSRNVVLFTIHHFTFGGYSSLGIRHVK